jgi:hypothetical protein
LAVIPWIVRGPDQAALGLVAVEDVKEPVLSPGTLSAWPRTKITVW